VSTGKSESGDNLGVGLGIGLGVGIPFVFGVIAAFWFFRRRRSRAVQLACALRSVCAVVAEKLGAVGASGECAYD
jgi:hypothetical protein